jgi:hypothetical protein
MHMKSRLNPMFNIVKLCNYGTKKFAPSMISGSSPVVTHMMATGDLHGR